MAKKNLRIKVSTQGAKKAGKELGGVDNRLKGLAKSAALAATGFFGTRALLSGMKEAIRLAGIQEEAEKKLSIALGGNTSALLKQASALQQVTTAGDEAIIEQQAFLASLKFTEEQIKEIIPVALDLSAATGISLESAVRNTAKTFSGLSGELGELIPQLRGLTAEEMKAGEAVKVMADLFGGQATEQAQTMTGAIEQAKNVMGDAAEEIGTLLSPAVVGIAKELKFVAGFWAEWTGNINKNKEELNPVSSQLDEVNKKIKEQASLIAQQTSPAYAELTARRAEFNELTIFDQVAQDTKLLNENQETLDKLNEKKKTLLELKKEDLGTPPPEPDIIRIQDEIGANAELVDVKKVLGEMEAGFDEESVKAKEEKLKLIQDELKQAALVQGSAQDAMKAVVRAESMEAVSGLIASILKTVPFPANLILAAGAGATASKLIDKGLSSFAQGGDFVTSGPQMMMVGDNPGGRERVQVTPLSSPNVNGPQQGVTVNISGGVVQDDYVRNELIPALNKATGTGASLNA